MPIVYACIAPHGGNLLLGETAPGPVPACRKAMHLMRQSLEAARPDCIAILTPHGIGIDGGISLGMTETGYGELEGLKIKVQTDMALASAWADFAAKRRIPVMPLVSQDPSEALPLDWGVTIPLALLTPGSQVLPTVVACPARDVSPEHLVGLGEALVEASESLGRRVALIISADQGHGHAADGPYGYTRASALYDAAMRAAIKADDLPRLLNWSEQKAEKALADSYWQTLLLIGVQKHVPLRAHFLAYEVDHYFGLLCAEFKTKDR
jgi:aromatic ring-opening dioxygenase LigB subunit